MTSKQAAEYILTALHAIRQTPLEAMDIEGAINSDIAAEGVDIPIEEECDRLAQGGGALVMPPDLSAKYPSISELVTNN